MEKSRKTTTKSDPSTGDQLSNRRAETWPGRVRRSLVAFRSPTAGRMPKPSPVVCAEALPPVAFRSPARRRYLPGAARPGTARAGGGRETGKTDSTTVEIVCACRRMTGLTRRFANFWKQIEKNHKVLSVYGGSVLRIEKNAKFDAPVGLLGRVSRTGSNYDSLEETQWLCASFGQLSQKSRKTTKSYPSAGDQFYESRKTAKFDAPVGLLGRVSRTGSNYDSLEEAQWPCASFCQLSENRGKRQSPIRLRGISWGNENLCLNLFQQSSVPCRADRWVNGGSNKEPLI